MRSSFVVPAGVLACANLVGADTGLVNWESPHIHPLALTPDGTRLLAVNTAAATLEVFGLNTGQPARIGSVPVGLDPVTVRVRSNAEAWVVNHVSDSVSVVDLVTMSVTATVRTGDEPTDVVFAGVPERAFVAVSQENRIEVFDPSDLGVAPVVVVIAGEDPRALATDGARVFAAIFEAGNGTTILSQTVVSSSVNPYPGNQNPPPNDGTAFEPPIDADLPAPPEVSLIVRKDDTGVWRDDNGGDWSAAVTWDLHGHDVAVIDAASLDVAYVNGLHTLNMSVGVSPLGDVIVVGTEATNQVRFEPNVRGSFVRVMAGRFPATGGTPVRTDLNPHLDYSTGTVEQALRDQSIGDPRGIGFAADGTRTYVTGMGSNNLVVLDGSLTRQDWTEVGEGPTGVTVDDARGAVYVLNRFEGSLSTVSMDTLTETARTAFHDPTPLVIRNGRPLLYDTHATSGLGQVSCASCHVDGRMDQLAWDLGDPSGEMKPFNQVCNFGVGGCEDWHPMKGPMATQTLMGIVGTEPFHWRADREDLAAFSGAFVGLMGDDAEPTAEQMLDFELFVATLMPPPNPFRNELNKLPTYVPETDGNPRTGSSLFTEVQLDAGALTCNDCHALPTGTNGELTSAALILETQSMKIPQLRNLYEKTGFDDESTANNRGFGFIHDGSVDSTFEFLEFPGFDFAPGEEGNQQRRDVASFLFALSTDTHAGVGQQVTVDPADSEAVQRREDLERASNLTDVALVVKGLVDGAPRGWVHLGSDVYQSDRAGETMTTEELDGLAVLSPLTWTLVPLGTEVRYGVDRDADGYFDQDERDACSDPADPDSVPGDPGCPADLDGDGIVGVTDLLAVLAGWGGSGDADVDCDGEVGVEDLLAVLGGWGACG